MKKDYTHIGIVLDSSSSMGSIQDSVKSMFREFFETQKQLPGECTYSFYSFNSKVDRISHFKDLKSEKEDFMSKYIPSGMTALLDGIGVCIDEIGKELRERKEEDRPEKVLVAIITDGEENASREYDNKKINDMIKSQKEDYSWEFIFLAANQDAIKTGATFGVSANRCMNYSATELGVVKAGGAMRSFTASYRGGADMKLVKLGEDQSDSE